MGKFLTVTFSPAMLMPGREANVEEISLDEAIEILGVGWQSAVGHEVTAQVLSALLGVPVPFARVNLALDHGDTIICVIPNFRAAEAREFTRAEVEGAGYRVFAVSVQDLR